jgi:hypothetical protein
LVPLAGTFVSPNVSYLHERDHKRELRRESAQEGTQISASEHEDLKRNLEFTLRMALVQTLEAKTVVEMAKADFDVAGTFDFTESLQPLDDFREIALDTRPDLQAALETVQQSETNHKLAEANGSTDPTLAAWYMWNSAVNNPNPNDLQTLGGSVSIPLRVFDRNQGEKKRTQIDIDRSKKAGDAARAQVFSDVDTAYELVRSNIELLKPYKTEYNDEALKVRDTVTHSAVPASAILHLHDREWVFVPAGQGQFKRVEVAGGDMLPGGQQVILSGVAPGQQVVKDVLNLEAAVEAQ